MKPMLMTDKDTATQNAVDDSFIEGKNIQTSLLIHIIHIIN